MQFSATINFIFSALLAVTGCSKNSGFGPDASASPATPSSENKSKVNSDKVEKSGSDEIVNEPVMVGGAYLTCSFVDVPATDVQSSSVDCFYSMNQTKMPLRKDLQIKIYVIEGTAKSLQKVVTFNDSKSDHFAFEVNQQATIAANLQIDVYVGSNLLQSRQVIVAAKGTSPQPVAPPPPVVQILVNEADLSAIAPELHDRDAIKRLVYAGGENITLVSTWTCKDFENKQWFTSRGPTAVFVDDGGDQTLGDPSEFLWTCASSPTEGNVYRAECLRGALDYFSCKPKA